MRALFYFFLIFVLFVSLPGCRGEKGPVTILFTSDVNGRIRAFG